VPWRLCGETLCFRPSFSTRSTGASSGSSCMSFGHTLQKWGERLFILTLPSFTPFITQQESFVSGRVIDRDTKNPIPLVNVVLMSSAHGTSTDSVGRFAIKIPGGKPAVLIFSHVGYTKLARRISATNGDTSHHQIELEPRSIGLDEVIVKGKRPREEQFARYVLREKDLEAVKGKSVIQALHHFYPWLLPRSEPALTQSLESFMFFVDGARWEPEYLDELNPLLVQRILIWESRWAPVAYPAGIRTRYVVGIDTK